MNKAPSIAPSVSRNNKFRSQLGHLLSKHALFQVRIHIDQLSNVPLTGGQFALRWKFKNAQSRSSILAKMKVHRSDSCSAHDKARAKPRVSEEYDGRSSIEDAHSIGGGSMYEDAQDDDSSGHLVSESPLPLTMTPISATPTVRPGDAVHTPLDTVSEARGMTEWVKLKNYNVKWDATVSVIVQMDVHRETGDLLPNELKLVVVQRVISGDPESPQNPRLGAVYLNLAEYADAGPVTRRYLLRQSKTNATLKLTIELEHVGGEKVYVPAPLRKSEIMAEVSGLLSNSGLLRAHLARDLDQYTRPELEELDMALMKQTRFPYPYADVQGRADPKQLASSYGLHATEALIDALFNPVPTSSSEASPFTYYVPSEMKPTLNMHELDGGSADGDERSSLASATRSMTSDSYSPTTGTGDGRDPPMFYAESEDSSSMGSADKPVSSSEVHRHWWQKMRTRPPTPIGRYFRPTTPVNLPPVPALPKVAA